LAKILYIFKLIIIVQMLSNCHASHYIISFDTKPHITLLSFIKCIEFVRGLTPKGRRPFFGLFLEFGQPIVDAIFIQKISNFWWTCGLVLASRRTNFYKIPISGSAIMPQKQNYFELWAASGNQKTFYFLTFLDWIFFHKFLTKFLNISSTWKSSKIPQIS
jgi:hypothetical protein